MNRLEAMRMVDHLSAKAVDVLKADGYHSMIVMLITPSGMQIVGVQPVLEAVEEFHAAGRHADADAAMDRAADAVRAAAKAIGAFGFILVSEVWTLRRQPSIIGGDEPGLGGIERPRFAPDRVEALSLAWEFVAEDAGRISGSRTWEFSRRPGKEDEIAEVGPPHDIEGQAGGRFSNIV